MIRKIRRCALGFKIKSNFIRALGIKIHNAVQSSNLIASSTTNMTNLDCKNDQMTPPYLHEPSR